MGKYRVNFEIEADCEEDVCNMLERMFEHNGIEENDFQVEKVIETIKVVVLEPGKRAKVAEIPNELKAYQAIVDGLIETGFFFEDNAILVCNEEGKIKGMPHNRTICDKNGRVVDIIAGRCFICGNNGCEFGSLTDKQIKKYMEKFDKPERFVRINGEIFPIKYNPKEDE